MYERHFGLAKRPFASVCQVEQYFAAASIETARASLARCLERGEGAGMVVGPSGTGKTMLLRVLAEQFRQSFAVALLNCGRLSSRRALFQSILHEMDQRIRGLDEGELRLALVDYLTIAPDRPQGLVLLVDEAHTLPGSLLDEIRMLTNLVNGGQPAVRVALAGSCLLEERFAHPRLDSFNQRIVARSYLEAMNRTETRDYVRSQVERVGGTGTELFCDEACDAVFNATDGVARLVNQVCDHALLVAYAEGATRIDAASVQEAWADLQQLPTPWNDDEPAEGNIIEFGGLDDATSNSAPEADEPTLPSEAGGVVEIGSLEDDPVEEAIRLSSDTSDGLDDGEDPAARVERIESMLSGVDQDTEEPPPEQPVLELVFDDPDDLLSEPFDEEEVIGDRFAVVWDESSEANPLDPDESERESVDVPAATEPVCEEPAEPMIEREPAAVEQPLAAEEPAESMIEQEPVDESPTVPEPFEPSQPEVAVAALEPLESAPVAVTEWGPSEPQGDADWAAEDSREMSGTIPFEAEAAVACGDVEAEAAEALDEDPRPAAATASAVAGRRPSYSRLFAKLRYG